MNYNNYSALFQTLQTEQPEPYNNPDYLHYLQMNQRRSKRAETLNVFTEDQVNKIKALKEVQKWVVITEHWCGDAAHSVPLMNAIAQQNENIDLTVEFRDAEPFRINDFLTNGTKSIPILVQYDVHGNYLNHWGPRPKELSEAINALKAEGKTKEEFITFAQNWYHKDAGKSTVHEIIELFF